MTLSNGQAKVTARRQGDRIIRVMAPLPTSRGFRFMTFSEDEVAAVAALGEDQAALVLRTGAEIPVALAYKDLEQKIYRPDFKTDDDGVLDLCALTGEAAKPALSQLKPGTPMPDGTIFAGQLPETGKGIFLAPPVGSTAMNFNEAARFAATADRCGYRDWRLPTPDELKVMFNNRAEIGGFEQGEGTSSAWYWGSTERGGEAAQHNFHSGNQIIYAKTDKVSVRYVRG